MSARSAVSGSSCAVRFSGCKTRGTPFQSLPEICGEGLITIAPDQKVLSFNPSALTLLHAPPGNYQGRSYLNISRSDELHRCVCTALSGASADGQILEEGQCCRIF